MQKNIKEYLNGRDIVIWGVGVMQTDLEGLYSFKNVLYYVDDFVREKNLISVTEEQIYSSQRVQLENPKNVLFILCGDEQDAAMEKLRKMGYKEEDYILGQELLVNHEIYENLHQQPISIWGIGNTYGQFEAEIKKYTPNICNFIVSDLKEAKEMEKSVLSLEQKVAESPDSFIIVTSIYYKDIYKKMGDMGLQAGKDFIHIYTLLSLGNYSSVSYENYLFEDRRKDSEDLLIVLAGYKELVWDTVIPRIRAYAPKNMDVCIITSGLVNQNMQKKCEKYGWSYLSTSWNNVSYAQNLAILLHQKAKYIYKMDEDIFLTKGIFETLKETFQNASKEHEIGFVSSLIPINGYGYVRLLEKFDAVKEWEEQFGVLKYTDGYNHNRAIHDDPKAAKFMWGEGNPKMVNLDQMNQILKEQEAKYSVCPIRFSIGFILLHRNTWLRMGMFPVIKSFNMGSDEECLCKYCFMQARLIIVSENAVVGHLHYTGLQNKELEEYYSTHKEKFILPMEDWVDD